MAAFLSRPSTAPAASYEITDSGNSNMKVVVRIRPENELEIRSNCQSVARVLDEHVLVFDPSPDNAPTFQDRGPSGHKRRHILGKKHKDLRFAFDRVFDETASQVDVFEHTTKSIINGVLDGINCSVFAYGATGAGKTYTMLGNLENPGVMFLTMMELYRRINELRDEKTCEVAVSYCEVYNETLQDLLAPSSGTLHLREDGHKGLVVSGLTKHKPRTANGILSLLEIGNRNRTQHPTDANATSSRSHAVFQVFIHQKARTAGLSTQVTCAKMSLIDLAGSERATVTTNRGTRLREGANINKSLLALGNCINALADSKGKTVHVPYRNSKLTRLLKDSLGGNCRTVMIANISPSALSYEDTYNTLKYADRAKQIKTKCVRNVLNVDFHVVKYKSIVQELQKEISELKAKLDKKTPKKQTVDTTEAARLQDLVQGVYGERSRLRKHMADLDASEREALLKVCRKERDLQRIDTLTSNEAKKGKVSTRIELLRQQIVEVQQRKQSVHEYLFSNNESIGRVQAEINASCSTSSASSALRQLMEANVAAKKLESENAYQWKQTKHLLKYIKSQEKETGRTERMLVLSLELVRRQQIVLKASHTVTSSIQEMYDSLVRVAEGEKGVAWADLSADSLHDVSMSSLSQSQQALFDSFLVHSSPARRNATRSQPNSPSITSSLGILTSIMGAGSQVSASSSGISSTAPRSSKCTVAHPLFETKSKSDIAVPSPQPDIVQSSRLQKTMSPVRPQKSGVSFSSKPRMPAPMEENESSSSFLTYSTRLNTVLNSTCVKSSPFAPGRNADCVSSSSSSSRKADVHVQPYTLPHPSPKTSPKPRERLQSDSRLMTSASTSLPHPETRNSGPAFSPLRPPSFAPPPAFSRTGFSTFDDNFVSPARPDFSRRPLPKTPVLVQQQQLMKNSPSLQNLHPNPNNFVPAFHQASPAVLCRPITSPLPSHGSYRSTPGLPKSSSMQVSQLVGSSYIASHSEASRAAGIPVNMSQQRPSYEELIQQSRQSRSITAAVRHPHSSASVFNPAVPVAVVMPSPMRPPQGHIHQSPHIAVTSTSHQTSPQPDYHRTKRRLSGETDLNSTYTVSAGSTKSTPFDLNSRQPVSAFSSTPFNPLVLLHANSPKAMSARPRTVGGTLSGAKRAPNYLQMTKAAASKRVTRDQNKENQPSSNGKPIAKPKRLQSIQPRFPSALQSVW